MLGLRGDVEREPAENQKKETSCFALREHHRVGEDRAVSSGPVAVIVPQERKTFGAVVFGEGCFLSTFVVLRWSRKRERRPSRPKSQLEWDDTNERRKSAGESTDETVGDGERLRGPN